MDHNFATPEIWTRETDLALSVKTLNPGEEMFLLCRHEVAKFDRYSAKRIADELQIDLIREGFEILSAKEYNGQYQTKPCWHWLLNVKRPDPFGE